MAAKGTTDAEVREVKPFSRMIHAMAQVATADNESPGITGDSLSDVLTAGTIEEMWEAGTKGPLGGRDLVDCELGIRSFTVKYGRDTGGDIKTIFTTPNGRQMYLLISAYRISNAGGDSQNMNTDGKRLPEVGEVFEFNTSAPDIVSRLMWLAANGYFAEGKPAVEVVIKSIPLGGGQAVLKLQPAPKRAQQSATA